MAGNCIIDDDVCREASLNEIVRRYFKCLCDQKASGVVKPERFKLELLMNQAGIAWVSVRSKSVPMPCPKPLTVSLPLRLNWPTARLSQARPARCWVRHPRPC